MFMADQSESLGFTKFTLKRSWVSIAFQLFILSGMMLILYQQLNLWLWLLMLLVAAAVWLWLIYQPRVLHFEQLELDQWSLLFSDTEQIHRYTLLKMIDHSLYIVLYFQDKKARPVVVWCDQMSRQQWKMLKGRARLS